MFRHGAIHLKSIIIMAKRNIAERNRKNFQLAIYRNSQLVWIVGDRISFDYNRVRS